jgi:hypothetical protein
MASPWIADLGSRAARPKCRIGAAASPVMTILPPSPICRPVKLGRARHRLSVILDGAPLENPAGLGHDHGPASG